MNAKCKCGKWIAGGYDKCINCFRKERGFKYDRSWNGKWLAEKPKESKNAA